MALFLTKKLNFKNKLLGGFMHTRNWKLLIYHSGKKKTRLLKLDQS